MTQIELKGAEWLFLAKKPLRSLIIVFSFSFLFLIHLWNNFVDAVASDIVSVFAPYFAQKTDKMAISGANHLVHK